MVLVVDSLQEGMRAMGLQVQEALEGFGQRLDQHLEGAAARAGGQAPEGAPAPRAHARFNGQVLPDFPMPSLNKDQIWQIKMGCHSHADVMCRELFKYFVGFRRYQQWVHQVNWDGSDDKAALPLCLRDSIMAILNEEFTGNNLPECRARINEFLRMPRRTEWPPVLERSRKTLIACTRPRHKTRPAPTPPAGTRSEGNSSPPGHSPPPAQELHPPRPRLPPEARGTACHLDRAPPQHKTCYCCPNRLSQHPAWTEHPPAASCHLWAAVA